MIMSISLGKRLHCIPNDNGLDKLVTDYKVETSRLLKNEGKVGKSADITNLYNNQTIFFSFFSQSIFVCFYKNLSQSMSHVKWIILFQG